MARPTPVLKRVDVMFTKDDGSPQKFQVPANGVPVDFYAQGATVKLGGSAITVPPFTGPADERDIPVYHPGVIRNDDDVHVDITTNVLRSIQFTVGTDGISGTLHVKNITSPGGIAVDPGKRLVLLNRRPLLFDDPTGLTSTGTSQRNTDTNGRLVAYVGATRFDFILTVGAGDVRPYVDAEGSYVMRI